MFSRILAAMISPYRTAGRALRVSSGVRNLALLTGINSIGNGLFASISVIYYTKHLGFSVGFVSTVLFVATVLAMGGDFLSGRLSDRGSPKPIFLIGLLMSAAASLGLVLVRDGGTFFLVLCLISLGQGMCMSSNTTLIRRLSRENPALTRASLRSILTVGTALGAVLAGGVLANDSLLALQIAIIINASTFVASAVLLAAIDVVSTGVKDRVRTRLAIPDGRFMLYSASNGIISLYLHAFSFALPLWFMRHHIDLIWLVGVVIAVNSLFAAILQIPASVGISSVQVASRRLVLGSVCLGVSYLFFLGEWEGSPAVLLSAVVLLVAFHTAGEVLYSAGSMELLFRLAPAERQGQYGAFLGISNGVISAFAPVVFGFFISAPGGAGWWIIAIATVGLGLLIRAVSRASTSR